MRINSVGAGREERDDDGTLDLHRCRLVEHRQLGRATRLTETVDGSETQDTVFLRFGDAKERRFLGALGKGLHNLQLYGCERRRVEVYEIPRGLRSAKTAKVADRGDA